MTDQPLDGKTRFLSQADIKLRGHFYNFFLNSVRTDGASEPEDVVCSVISALSQRKGENAKTLLAIVKNDLPGALECAKAATEHDRQPLEVRMAQKAQARAEALRTIPPSEKQLSFLRRLGYTGPPPASMAEAGDNIDALLRNSGGRK